MKLTAQDPNSRNVRIFLDGFLQRHAFEADNTLNYVRRYKRVNGNYVFNPQTCTYETETVFGSVWFDFPKEGQ